MIDRVILFIGIILMSFGGSAVATNLHLSYEIGIFTIGLLLIGNASFFTLKKRIQILEVKLASQQTNAK